MQHDVSFKILREIYEYSMLIALRLWEMLRLLEESGMYESKDGSFPYSWCYRSRAEWTGKALRIVVDDWLPRVRDVWTKNREVAVRLRRFWEEQVKFAVDNLDAEIRLPFDRVLCKIVTFGPSTEWDVDNRAYKLVVDALWHAGVVKKDTCDNLALLLAGDVEKSCPRTEIWVYPVDQKLTELEVV